MAHPYFHSLSSVKSYGGKTSDYNHLHDWMDATKSVFADFRHRALRHHRQGAQRACEQFGFTITNSDGAIVSTQDVLQQHIIEDCEQLVDASDWIKCLKPPLWFKPNSLLDKTQAIEKLGAKCGLKQVELDKINPIIEFFYETYPISANINYMAMLWHSYGIFEAENKLGSVFDIDGKKIPVRYAAEVIIQMNLKSIPSPKDWLKNIPSELWMVRTKKIERTL